MLRYFIIILSLIFLIVSMIQISKWIYGETSTQNGIIAIIALVGSLSYLTYFFSESNAEARQTTLSELLTPVRSIGQHAADAALDGAETAVVVRGSRHAANFMSLPSVAGAITTGAYFYSIASLPVVLNAMNSVLTFLFSTTAGPAGPIIFAVLASTISMFTHDTVTGGRRLKKKA
jgi:hypothetical protein